MVYLFIEMGATNSLPNYETKYSETPDKTRLVTIINKTATGNVIEISEAVVNRLRHGAISMIYKELHFIEFIFLSIFIFRC